MYVQAESSVQNLLILIAQIQIFGLLQVKAPDKDALDQNVKLSIPRSLIFQANAITFIPYQHHQKISHAPGKWLPKSNNFDANFSILICC